MGGGGSLSHRYTTTPLPLPLLGVFETNYKMAASDGECCRSLRFYGKEGTVNSLTEQGTVCMAIDKMCNNQFLMASFNPLSPNSDQHQFSPNDIRTLSRD